MWSNRKFQMVHGSWICDCVAYHKRYPPTLTPLLCSGCEIVRDVYAHPKITPLCRWWESWESAWSESRLRFHTIQITMFRPRISPPVLCRIRPVSGSLSTQRPSPCTNPTLSTLFVGPMNENVAYWSVFGNEEPWARSLTRAGAERVVFFSVFSGFSVAVSVCVSSAPPGDRRRRGLRGGCVETPRNTPS